MFAVLSSMSCFFPVGHLMIAVGGFQGNAAVSNAAAEVAEPAVAPAAHAEVPEQAWGVKPHCIALVEGNHSSEKGIE